MSKDIDNTAFFIKCPRRIEDFKKLNIPEQRKVFTIEKTIVLSKYDYENFISDFCIDRWFIEENVNLCYVDDAEIWHCILVKQFGKNKGVLIQSDGCVYTKYAAYYNSDLFTNVEFVQRRPMGKALLLFQKAV